VLLPILMDEYQHQPIGILVRLGVLHDIAIWHPWAHDAEWKQCLRNLNDGEYVRVGKILAPLDFLAKDLVRSALSLTLIKKGTAHPFHFLQATCIPRPNRLDAYLVPMIIFLPNVRESKGIIVQRFITELYVGENA